MPNWKAHLEIAKRLNEKYKMSILDYQMFMLGSILPDINQGYLVTNVSKIIGHNKTHYGYTDRISYLMFYKLHSSELENNPLIYGYFVHLYTDYIFNKKFYEKHEHYENDINQLRIDKQSDFKLYENKFISNYLKIDDLDKALDLLKSIEQISITKDDINKSIDYIASDTKVDSEYKICNEAELDEVMNKVISNLEDDGFKEYLKYESS